MNESLPGLPAHPKGTVTGAGPIRVYARDGKWLVHDGSSMHGAYGTRDEAIRVGRHAAFVERRELMVEGDLALGEPQGQQLTFTDPQRLKLEGNTGMSGEGTEPAQPPEAVSLTNIGPMYWPARRLGVWLSGDPHADLALEAIREREHMRLLEGDPRYRDKEGQPAEPTTTTRGAEDDRSPRPDRPPPAETTL
jgi:hypothetical protein